MFFKKESLFGEMTYKKLTLKVSGKVGRCCRTGT